MYYTIFPIHGATFIGVAANQAVGNRGVIKAKDAGDVTFHYTAGDKVITMSASEVLIVEGACTGITATALQNVYIS